jgi:PAS domain S-box-containing protein
MKEAMPMSEHPERLFELAPDSIMTRTKGGIIKFWNRSAEELYGWRKEEAVGKVSHNLLRTQFPKPLEEIESELVGKGRWEGKLVHTTREGRRVVVESRWTVDLERQPEQVIEINKRSSDANSSSAGLRPPESLPTNDIAQPSQVLTKLADAILAAGGLLCLLALSHVGYNYGAKAPLLFYALPGLLLATLLVSLLRLSAIRKITFAVLLCSVGASIYVSELLLNLWSVLPSAIEYETRQMRARAAKDAGVNFDRRSREEVVDDLRRQGTDAVPSIFGQAFLKGGDNSIRIGGKEVLPLGGVSSKVVVLCNEAGRYVTYKSDGHGFSNPEEIWNKVPMSIAVLGDSFAHGYCVPPDQTFVARIRERYPATLNLGIEGNGPLLMLASLKEYASGFKPKTVLWFYFEGNDVEDLRAEAENPVLKNYLDPGAYRQGLMGRQAQLDNALLEYLEKLKSKGVLVRGLEESWQVIENFEFSVGRVLKVAKLSELRERLGLVYGGARAAKTKRARIASTGDRDRAIMELFKQILLNAKQEVGSWGGKLYFVYLPSWDPYGDPTRASPYRKRVLEIVKSVELPIIDVHETFTQQSDPLDLFPHRVRAHYTEQGNRLIAEQVLQFIAADR